MVTTLRLGIRRAKVHFVSANTYDITRTYRINLVHNEGGKQKVRTIMNFDDESTCSCWRLVGSSD
jgi:hypothetical protein